MTDYAGPLQRIVLSRTLWLIALWPLLGFVWQAIALLRKSPRGESPSAAGRGSGRNAGAGFAAIALTAAIAHVIVLFRLPPSSRVLAEHVLPGVRIGQVDVGIDISLDPLSAAFCILACAVALAASASIAPEDPLRSRALAWIHLSLAGALVAFLADGFVGTAVGWALAGAAAAWLAGWNDAAAGVVAGARSDAAVISLLIGAALIFWGLGGSWDGDDYLPSAAPRFAVVEEGDPRPSAPSSPENAASLTFTGLPGATVTVDDSRAQSIKSPFLDQPVRPGNHTLRIHSGGGANDALLPHVAFEADEQAALVSMGPTLSFRALSGLLTLHDRDGNCPARSALGGPFGLGATAVATAALAALLAAAWAIGGAPPPLAAPASLAAVAQGATTAALGPYLIARTAWLLPEAQGAWIAVESVGAILLLQAGWRAPRSPGRKRSLAFFGATPGALTYLALGAAGVSAAAPVFVLSGAATAAVYLSAVRASVSAVGHVSSISMRAPPPRAVLVTALERLGDVLVGMDRWVIAALAGTLATLVRAAAWVLTTLDMQAVGRPGNVVALKMARVAGGFEPALGFKLRQLAWALLGLAALAAVAHALLVAK